MNLPLRILFITGEYPPMQGGVADYTRALSRALVGLGGDVPQSSGLGTPRANMPPSSGLGAPDGDVPQSSGLETPRANMPPSSGLGAPGGNAAQSGGLCRCEVAVLTSTSARGAPDEPGITLFPQIARWDWGMWRALDKLTAAWKPDIVHIQYQTAAFGMHPAINLWPWRPWHPPSVPTAVTFHDLRQPYLFPKAHLVRRWVMHTLARNCTLAITTNPEDTANLKPYRPDLIEIPIGSNIPCTPPPGYVRAAWRAHLGLPEHAAVLCYFGFLNASKGGEMLVDMLDRLVGRGFDAHLLMIGGRVGASDPTNAAYLQTVEARIAAAGLAARVHWTGHVPTPEVSAAFLAADLCVLPYQDGVSYRRGSFMAALAHGMPILTTPPAAPYPDLIAGENVLLAPPDDVEAQTAAAVHALSDPALRQRLGQNAARLAQQFGWEAIAARSLAAYTAAVRSAHA